MSKLLWKAVKCDTISNVGTYAPKMAGVAHAHRYKLSKFAPTSWLSLQAVVLMRYFGKVEIIKTIIFWNALSADMLLMLLISVYSFE
jgi:hypothetical protein